MANRYASIVANVAKDTANTLEELLREVPDASWTAKDGKLVALVEQDEFEMTFERGDPLTEALLLLLNHRNIVLSHIRQGKQ